MIIDVLGQRKRGIRKIESDMSACSVDETVQRVRRIDGLISVTAHDHTFLVDAYQSGECSRGIIEGCVRVALRQCHRYIEEEDKDKQAEPSHSDLPLTDECDEEAALQAFIIAMPRTVYCNLLENTKQ
jgi:hypothetical protein